MELENVDGLKWVRNNEENLFSSTNRGLELTTKVVGDVLILVGSAYAFSLDDWWVIGSDRDWIERTPGYSVSETFSQIVPFREAGDNSMRAEILLFCFARDVITFAFNEVTVVKGDLRDAVQVANPLIERFALARTVLFRL